MSIPGAASPLFLATTAGADAGFEISRSLRFNSADSAYLNRTPSAAGNRKTWTWSGWVKRSALGSATTLFSADVTASSDYLVIRFESDTIRVDCEGDGQGRVQVTTSAVYRDPSAWYHIVVALDTTQSTAADRCKIYVNSALQTTSNTLSQNKNFAINATVGHEIGRRTDGNDHYFDGYLAEVNFIDGQALAPTDFGETDDNGVWRAKEFSGTYGPLVNQSQTWSSGITTALRSGDPATKGFDGDITTSTVVAATDAIMNVDFSNITVNSKIEVIGQNGYTTPNCSVTVGGTTTTAGGDPNTGITNNSGGTVSRVFNVSGTLTNIKIGKINSSRTRLSQVIVDGKILVDSGVSVADNSFRLAFTDNSSNAALGTDSSGNSNTWTVNNLTAAAPGLATANQGFDVVAYTGDGNTGRSISSLSFSPDLVWFKNRGTANYHQWHDRVRGPLKRIYSNASDAENNYTTALTSFDSNGWTMGNGTPCNANGNNYVAWCWKAGGAASSNTDGSVTSSVSASNTYGFSIVSFTDGGSACTIGHGLNSAPKWILVKFRGASGNWSVYHESIGNDHRLKLNLTDAKQSGNDWWNATSPTSSVFSLGSNLVTSTTQIAYCWSEIAGFSKFSSYSGNNGTQTIDCGFSPAVVLIKCTTSANNWIIQDSARGIEVLYPNTNDAEFGGNYVSLTGTGFTLNTSSSLTNSSGQTYIYAAFAAKPDQSVIDSLVDTPTNGTASTGGDAGGATVGNYATLNPLDRKSTVSLSNGNLDATTSSTGWAGVKGTMGVSSGKYYFEATANGSAANKVFFGICASSVKPDTSGYLQDDTTERAKGMLIFCDNGLYQLDGNSRVSYSSSMADGDVISVAYDLDGNTVQFYKNGNALGSIDISSSPLASTTVVPLYIHYNTNTTYHLNFGQRAFAYAAPSGYKALCTSSLPEPTIADGSLYFDTKLYTGTGSAQSIGGLGFSPDLVWYKSRSNSLWHGIYDIVRGVNKGIFPNSTQAETNYAAVTAFNSDGFTIGTVGDVNTNTATYAAWAWDGGTSTVTNNDGSLASQVRASAASGFSIIKYTGNNTSGATVGHGLNAAPEFAIFRQIAVSNDWSVYSKAAGATGYLRLNLADAFTTTSGQFNNTDPNSSVITLGGDHNVNGPSNEIICYAFAPVEGYSSMGSFVGNGSTDGPFVYTGFKVAWLLTRSTSSSRSWNIWDTARDTHNPMDANLFPHNSNAEGSDPLHNIDMLSNGFKPRTGNVDRNGSGETYIYLALASNPFASNGGLAR